MAGRSLDDYVDVATRIQEFYALYPEGSLRATLIEDDGKRVVMQAKAYRSPADPLPAIGHAEEIRGEGMVNKTSAVENCETSAWGRALAALGLEVRKGIASRQEMEKVERQSVNGAAEKARAEGLTPAEKGRLTKALNGVDKQWLSLRLSAYGVSETGELTPSQASELVTAYRALIAA
jgi:hypothetical protein